MDRKAVFFDIDGTLVVCGGEEYIPQSAVSAIRQARKNGHLCFLCTGRSKAEIYPEILSVGVDGIVGAGGGFVEMGGRMLFHKRMDPQALERLVRYFVENGFDYYLESNGGLFASGRLIPRLVRLMFGEVPPEQYSQTVEKSPFLRSLRPGDTAVRDDVNKVCFLENPQVPFAEVKRRFGDVFSLIHCTVPLFGAESGEITVSGVGKAGAIAFLLERLGLTRADAFAFGDGRNDMDMLQYVGTGIAMGNACDELKAVADEVTAGQEQDGIYLSMKAHGLI